MVTYKYPQFFAQDTANEQFDKIYSPDAVVPMSGIYRCEGCGLDATASMDMFSRPRTIISILSRKATLDGGSSQLRIGAELCEAH